MRKGFPRSASLLVVLLLLTAITLLWILPSAEESEATVRAQIHTIVFQQGVSPPGYTGAKDTYIDGWYPNANYSDRTYLWFREDNWQVPLLNFDVFSIAGTAIVHAELELYVVEPDQQHSYRGPCTLAAYCVKKDWTLAEVTWNRASIGQDWDEAGCNGSGDRCPSPSGIAETRGVNEWTEPIDVTSIVQAWVNGENYGLVVRGYTPGSVGHAAFVSSRDRSADFRPKLTVQYMEIPTPTATSTNTPTSTPTMTHTPTQTATATLTSTPIFHMLYLPVTVKNSTLTW